MKKINLKEFTFLIPIRIDTIVRLENLRLSVNFLLKHFDTNIMILEASSYNNGLVPKLIAKGIDYIFIEDKDPIFYRTKYLNIMTSKAMTPFIGIWDADVIIPKEQIMDSVCKLRNGYDLVYPFSNLFYDTSDIIRVLYLKTLKIEVLTKNINKMHLTYGNDSVGGAFMVNKQSYIDAGMENERFYGWGPEDGDRYHRMRILGYKIHFSGGNLFHLSHPRGINSMFRSPNQRTKTRKEFISTYNSSRDELIRVHNLASLQ